MAGTPRVLVVEHERVTTLDRMSDLRGVEVVVVRPAEGERVPSAAGWSGVVVLGGPMAAWEDDVAPWLPSVRELLRGAVRHEVPTLGVCLGAQLLALATGGRVERGPDGPEVDVVEVRTTPPAQTDEIGCSLGGLVLAPQAHQDAVTRLPDDAVLLGSSARYRHQLFRVGPAAWGVQYHPEVSRAVFATWVEEHRGDLAREGTTPEAVMARFDEVDDDLSASARRHAVAFADVVRSRVRP